MLKIKRSKCQDLRSFRDKYIQIDEIVHTATSKFDYITTCRTATNLIGTQIVDEKKMSR